MKPNIATSEMTGRHYVVTRWKAPGVAGTKYDVTEEIEAMLEAARKPLREALEFYADPFNWALKSGHPGGETIIAHPSDLAKAMFLSRFNRLGGAA